jgi:hypothetical protein
MINITYTENKRLSNTNPTKNWGELCSGVKNHFSPSSHFNTKKTIPDTNRGRRDHVVVGFTTTCVI